MTEDEREELIEKITQNICVACGYRMTSTRRLIVQSHARAALAVAEPAIWEQCAKIADREANADTGFEKSDFLDGIAFGARVIANAIREGGKDGAA